MRILEKKFHCGDLAVARQLKCQKKYSEIFSRIINFTYKMIPHFGKKLGNIGVYIYVRGYWDNLCQGMATAQL